MHAMVDATITINGRPFRLRYPNSPAMQKAVKDVFTDGEYPFLPILQPQGKTILDIGASIGCSTVWFRALYPGAVILACEPAQEAFALLQANAAALEGVRVYRCGLYDRDCTTKLFHGVDSGVTNSVGRSAHNTGSFEVITLRRASSFLAEQGVGRIALLKLDTEGAEVPILRDLQPLLGQVEAIALEYHSERDRLEIDRLLSGRFGLCAGKIHFLHRGALTYVARELMAARTQMDQFEIVLPEM
jgi:FkbM family methyltransferase